jgi:hypothetical protein
VLAWLVLILVSIATGVLIHLVLRRFSNQAALQEVKRRKKAWMYELRLYVDEPKLIARAQLALFKDNLRHIAILGKPLLVLALPTLLVFVLLDAAYSRRPLTPGDPVTLTVRLASPFPAVPPRLETPEGITVETPPVRIPAENEVSWRIRPAHAVTGTFRIRLADETLEYPIRAGTGSVFQSPWVARGKRIQEVAIPYPEAGWAWLWWFTGISLATVLILNRRFGVSF